MQSVGLISAPPGFSPLGPLPPSVISSQFFLESSPVVDFFGILLPPAEAAPTLGARCKGKHGSRLPLVTKVHFEEEVEIQRPFLSRSSLGGIPPALCSPPSLLGGMGDLFLSPFSL